MSDSVFSNRGYFSEGSPGNALDFIVRSIIRGMVNTAIPVKVEKVYPGENGVAGYVQAIPLVMPRDPQNKAIQTVSIPKLPFFRYFAGRCAIVCDPMPGDIGFAVFSQQDASTVKPGTKEPQQAGSFRCFDMSDGFYFGGFLGGNGDTNISFDQNGNITINVPQAITVNCTTSTVNASESVSVNTPKSKFSGDVQVEGVLTVDKTINAQGDISSGSLSFQNHIHQCGDHKTDKPE